MHILFSLLFSFFFFNDTATTEIYTLSLHDALPISRRRWRMIAHTLRPYAAASVPYRRYATLGSPTPRRAARRSEEHTSELQSPCNLVCRLLLEKKKKHESKDVRLDHRPQQYKVKHT